MPSYLSTMPIYSLLLVLTVAYAAVAEEDLPPKETRPPSIVPPTTPDEDNDIKYFDIEDEQGVELPCRANGDEPITFEWTKNGEKLDIDDPKYISNSTKKSKFVRTNAALGDIVLTEHVDSDEGIYQCRASNIHGTSLSKPIYLYKATKRTFLMGMGKNIHPVVPSASLKISCNPPDNNPPGKVRWVQFSDMQEVKTYVELNERVAQDNDGNLYFANVVKDDEIMGEPYACEVFIRALNMYTMGPNSYIKVRDGVSTDFPVELVYNSPTTVVGLKGEPLQFKCIFTGNPTPQITWRRVRGGKLDRSRMKPNAQKLTLYNLKDEDAGVYECQGRNAAINKPQTKRFTLTVEAKPEWVSEPLSVDAGVEENAVFECAGEGKPIPRQQWYINGQKIESLTPDPYRVVTDGQLRFLNLDRDDAQVIQCNISNKHGYLWADVALSILAYKPELKAGFKKMRVAEHQRVVLPCEIDGKPKPTVYWKRGGQMMDGGPYSTHPNGNMTIMNVTLKDAAIWTCYAENRYGKFNNSGELIVREKTRIIKAPTPPQQKIRHGGQTLFECSGRTDEHETLRITWLFNGEPVDLSNPRMDVMSDNALRIQGLTSEDTGNYTCVASNGLDQDVASAQVNVIAPPDPPFNVSHTSCTSKKATVAWTTAQENFSPIMGFIVQHSHRYEEGIWRNITVRDPTKIQYDVDLSPFANYTFRVIAYNAMGESKPSEASLPCESNAAPPDVHPRRVHTDRSKPGVLIIKWDKMYPIEHNGPGFKYRIGIRKDGKTNITEISDWKENIKEIDFGKIYEPFEVFVEAINDEGAPDTPALLYRAYTGESVPLVVPEDFELVEDINVTATSATFQWTPVDTSPQAMQGEFTGYEIRFWKENERETTEERVKIARKAPSDPRVRRATKEIASVNSLPPYSKLEAEVVACNTLYFSNASNNVSLETEQGVPGEIKNGRVLLRGNHHFLLAWDKPDPSEHNGILTGYSIDYNEVNTFLPENIQEAATYDDPDRTRAYIDGLKASQEYRIYIYAWTEVGKGAPFSLDAKTANNEAPIKPQMVIALIDEDFINVTWNVATNSDNPAGHSHYVQYRRLGEINWIKTEKEQYKSWMNVSNLTPNTRYEVAVVAVSDVGEEVSELDTIVTTGNAPSTKPETNIAQATWFILMMVAIAVLILFLIIVCFIKRSRGEKYNVQEQEKLGGTDPESPDNNLYNDYPRSGETDPLAAGSPDSFDNDPDKLLGGSETDSMAEYGDVDPSKFNEDGSFIGQYGSSKPEEKGNQPSAMSTFV